MFEAGRPMLEKVLHDLNVAENEGAPPAPVLNPIMSCAHEYAKAPSTIEKVESSSTKAIGNAARQEGEGAARVARTRSSTAEPRRLLQSVQRQALRRRVERSRPSFLKPF